MDSVEHGLERRNEKRYSPIRQIVLLRLLKGNQLPSELCHSGLVTVLPSLPIFPSYPSFLSSLPILPSYPPS
jgi:hypothetical protein